MTTTTAETAASPSLPPWFAVGRKKFIAMYLASFGVYSLYWAWCNWKAMQARTGESFWVLLRTIFFGITSYYLFQELADDQRRLELDVSIEPGFYCFALIATGVAVRLPEPWWLLSFLAILVLLPVRDAIDEINERDSPGSATNEEFTGANIVLLILGAIWWLLVLVGTFLPPAA